MYFVDLQMRLNATSQEPQNLKQGDGNGKSI